MPLFGYVGIEGGEVVIPGEHFGVGAVWAAAVPLGAAGDGGLIFVAFVADPPDFFVAGGSDSLWCEGAILGWMPLGCNGWILTGEVVLAGDDLLAGADWATAAVDTGRNNCAPFMAFITNPPDFAPGAGDDVARREVAIFGWVPLAGELGIVGGEVVDAAQKCAIAADWAAGAGDAAFDLGAPFVAVGAKPPHKLVAAGKDVGRGECAVFGWVTLAGELGVSGGEVCFAGDGAAACAIGTACAAAATGVDGGLPVVAVNAGPPYAVLAAAGDGLWGEREIFLGVPLDEELFAVFAVTEIGQGFAHGDHLQNKKHVQQYQHIVEHARPTLGIFVAFCEIGAISRSIFCFLCVGNQRSFYLILMTSRFYAQNSVLSLRVLAKYAIMALTKMKDNFVFRFSSNNMLTLLVVYSTRRRLSSCCRQTLSGAAR